jgi:lysylphosphatidylglycerol synthetase-like protein (DUF2156 family)
VASLSAQPERALGDQRRGWLDHPSGYFALAPRNSCYMLPGVPGFISYRRQGRHSVMFGGVHAPEEHRALLLHGFIAEAERRRERVIAVQVRAPQMSLFAERGFTVNQFGTSYGVRLADHSFAGTSRMKLRNKIKRARTAGLRVLEVGRELPNDEATFARLRAVSADWLRAKKKKELDFMIGELGEPADVERRIFVVVDRAGGVVGFITYVPAFGLLPGYLHDLTRRLPAAPTGAMELCNATAMERLRADAEHLHFGFTPFLTGGQEEPPGSSRMVTLIVRLLGRYGRFIYPAQSQVDYKLKWGPQIVEPEYIAFRPLSVRAVIDLLLLTRSI